MKCAVLSNVGLVRKRNEDSYLANAIDGLFVVCDGIGGRDNGDVASSTAIDVIGRCLPYVTDGWSLGLLTEYIHLANKTIQESAAADKKLRDMATTCTAAAIDDHTLLVAHVGDSSLFIIRGDCILRITDVHHFPPPNEHVLANALGVYRHDCIDTHAVPLHDGDKVLLCSDGLTDMLGQDDILAIVQKERSLDKAVEALVQLALDRGGFDNVTVIVASI